MGNKVVKARDWTVVLYPENMIPMWQDRIYRQLQVPFEYIIHNRDTVELEEDETEPRKVHVHLVLHWDNPTTYNHVLTLVQDKLSALGKRCCNKVEPVIKLKYIHRYLTHETEDCKKACKFVYPRTEIITGNNWDLGSFIQLEEYTKLHLYESIRDFMIDKKITTCMDLEIIVRSGGFRYESDEVLDDDMILQHILNNRNRYVQVCKEINHKFKKKVEDCS